MIYDNLANISIYSEIPEEVSRFLLSLTSQTPEGHYEISENIYANVDVYETKPINKCKFEAHKRYIDIQMLLDGKEQLDCTSADDLKISEAYDENKDVMFFEAQKVLPDASYTLIPERFVLIYPHEAHRPQMASNSISETVKKVVVKIPV